jgi:HTH-type transcriptional regulator / antitoxin HigA
MPNQKQKILTAKEYNATMKKIDALMRKGEKNITNADGVALERMARAAEVYEKTIYTIPVPTTLEGLLELKMYERKLKQKQLARLLGVTEPKLSQIMSKKRKPDVAFLKAAHKKLGIDGNTLLEFV